MAGAAQPTASVSTSPALVALTGNPNSGKTTLFNALTGLRAKVGNYAGVTVERKEGRLVNSVVQTYPNVSQFWTYKPEEFLKNPVYSRDFPPAKNLE